MACVEAVCVSARKGMIKRAVESVELQEQWGIENDAHAGNWHRQVSLLTGESIDKVKEVLSDLNQGAFAENIITRGLDLAALPLGSRVRIGAKAELEITQIGKECHNSGCAIKRATGDCIMPREGIFAKVMVGGTVRPGDEIILL